MNVLFVSSGNNSTGLSPIIKSQAESLQNIGINIEHFTIKGSGFFGYLNNRKRLRSIFRARQIDVIHAHYALSAFLVATLFRKNVIVSLMGSDIYGIAYTNILIRILKALLNWEVVVKSEAMANFLRVKNMHVIANGVDIEKFQPKSKSMCQSILGWEYNKINILFGANPERKEKNFVLFSKAIKAIQNDWPIEVHFLKNIKHADVPTYLNAADVVVLTSLWEGSPNVIKESMACCRPIVSTVVGDVKWLVEDVPGHFICDFDEAELAENIVRAIHFSMNKGKTEGLKEILAKGLDSESVAQKLMTLYKSLS